MALSPDSSRSPLKWKFSQVFGERASSEEVQDVDIISAIGFDKTGDYLAVGDRGGRVVIFERKDGKDTSNQYHSQNKLDRSNRTSKFHPEYQYKTEFQSHEPEFDYLKSLEIEEKINKVRWCATPNGALFILSTNDKTIKLWKIKEHKVRKVEEVNPIPLVRSENALLAERSFISREGKPSLSNGYYLEQATKDAITKPPSQDLQANAVDDFENASCARCRKVYAHAHEFNINSISNNSDGETFISADDLRINLWNLEISQQCFNIIDMKPQSMEDLTEVITSAEFHPMHCNLLAYSSSRGFIRLVDMRQSALCDHSSVLFQDRESPSVTSFFTEIIASISDIKFTNDGRYILSRDYMNLKLWDVRMDSSPVTIFKVHEHLLPRLCELYDNDAIFDKFECCVSANEYHFASGTYSNLLRTYSYGFGNEEGITIEATKHPNRKPLLHSATRTRRSSLSNLTRGFFRQNQSHENSISSGKDFGCDLSSKLLHMAWHPTVNLIACGAGSSLFIYYA